MGAGPRLAGWSRIGLQMSNGGSVVAGAATTSVRSRPRLRGDRLQRESSALANSQDQVLGPRLRRDERSLLCGRRSQIRSSPADAGTQRLAKKPDSHFRWKRACGQLSAPRHPDDPALTTPHEARVARIGLAEFSPIQAKACDVKPETNLNTTFRGLLAG